MRGLPGMFFKGMRSKSSDKKEVEKEDKKPIKMTKMKKRDSVGREGHFDDERKKGEVCQHFHIYLFSLTFFLLCPNHWIVYFIPPTFIHIVFIKYYIVCLSV